MKGSTYKRGQSWYYRFRGSQIDPATGKYNWITKGGFRTREEADRELGEALQRDRKNRSVAKSSRTVRDFLEEWLKTMEFAVEPTSWEGYKYCAKLYVIPHIGAVPLQELDEPQLLRLYATLRKEGRVKRTKNAEMYAYWTDCIAKGERPTPRAVAESCGASLAAARAAVARYQKGVVPLVRPTGLKPKTVRNVHAMIRRALQDAVKWKYITDNPASNVAPPKLDRERRKVWNTNEVQAFLTTARRDRLGAIFLLELTTGIRRGHLCGLKWSDVDLEAGRITLHDSRVVVGGRPQEKPGGKTLNADRTISIDEKTVAALRGLRAIQDEERALLGPDYTATDYVFTTEDGRLPHPDQLRKRLAKLAAAAGVPQITFHDLRHTYATAALKAGVGPHIVSERIGHADVGFTLRIYAHVLADDDREAAQQAADFLIGDAWDSDETAGL